MKKINIIDSLSTVVLLMILYSQIAHTTGLYLSYTQFSGTKAEIVGNFISITIELLVLILVHKGYRSAGAWFAILLFFAGILFNHRYEAIDIQYTLYPFSITRFYLPYEFQSSTLIQFMSSLGIWLLTDIHAKKRGIQAANNILQVTYRREQVANKRIQEQIQKEQVIKDSIQNLEIKKTDLYKFIEQENKTLQQLYKEKQELSTILVEWQEEINSLKKAKPRFTQKGTDLHS